MYQNVHHRLPMPPFTVELEQMLVSTSCQSNLKTRSPIQGLCLEWMIWGQLFFPPPNLASIIYPLRIMRSFHWVPTPFPQALLPPCLIEPKLQLHVTLTAQWLTPCHLLTVYLGNQKVIKNQFLANSFPRFFFNKPNSGSH